MKQLSIPGTRKFQPPVRGDEAMRQHMRSMRKAMKMSDQAQADALRAKLAEHEQEIERKKAMAMGLQQQMQQQNAAWQEQLNDFARDIFRREGAVNQLRELLGPQPVEAKTDA